MSWPYPGDAPIARARRVAHAYRAALYLANAQACAELDELMGQWEQGWVVPRVLTYQPDDWLTVADAADVAGVGKAMLRIWRRRGVLSGRQASDHRWTYRAGDVLALAAATRRRPSSTVEGRDQT